MVEAAWVPFWGAFLNRYSPLTNGAHVGVQWADVAIPQYLALIPPPPPFDKTQVAWIQFQVFTSEMATTPYSFCVNNLTLLTAL